MALILSLTYPRYASIKPVLHYFLSPLQRFITPCTYNSPRRIKNFWKEAELGFQILRAVNFLGRPKYPALMFWGVFDIGHEGAEHFAF